MTLTVRKLSAILLAFIVAAALSFSTTCMTGTVYADDEEEYYSAIDITSTTDYWTPLFSDGNKAFKITVDSSSKVWGQRK
ncbi:MAG: hypothetical protein Q4A65_03080 [Bacillota bacterium]|nr:hypothetical protein [Bacillota bacterium]